MDYIHLDRKGSAQKSRQHRSWQEIYNRWDSQGRDAAERWMESSGRVYRHMGGRKRARSMGKCDRMLEETKKESKAIYQKKWKKANPEAVAKHQQKYIRNSREKRKEYRKKNRGRIYEYMKKYREENRKKLAKQRNEYKKIRRIKDPIFRLNERISNHIRVSLRRGTKNNKHWESLVGYTQGELIIHLEKQFKDGMTWENSKEWHIDHIIPISAFNFSKPEHEDFKRCWSLSNLQPLWATDNVEKSDKLDVHFQPGLSLEVRDI